MRNEVPKLVIPDIRNYGQEIADRLAGQDRVLEGLSAWAGEVNALLGTLVQQQADHVTLLERLSQEIAVLKSRQ
jgi:hypothetical protein